MYHWEFFLSSAVGMGFANKTGWEMGLVLPLHNPLDDEVVESARLVDISECIAAELKSH